MLRFFKSLLAGKKIKEPEVEAPYKVEAPSAAKCGCGRSQSGLCVGLHKLTPEEWATHADNPNKSAAKPKKSAGTKKSVTETKTAKEKKPAKPRAKKADK